MDSCKMAIIILIIIACIKANLSPLRVKQDIQYNDIIIRLVTYDIEDGVKIPYYTITFARNSYYFDNPFTFCFRKKVTNKYDNGTCSLETKSFQKYDCLYKDQDKYSYWKMSEDFLVIQNQVSYTQKPINNTNQLSTNILLSGQIEVSETQTVQYSFIDSSQQIYEVITVPGRDFLNAKQDLKRNFMTTGQERISQTPRSAENLLCQRNYQCYHYKNITNYIFTGGAIRNGQKIFFVAFVNIHNNQSSIFQLWQGISFSKDKSNRDMLGVIPSTYTVLDLYSLYLSAPFDDVGSNINGTNDWVTYASSENQQSGSNYYYMNLYRRYDTGDRNGDEVLRFKIKNQFCYAAYFQFISQGETTTPPFELIMTNPNFMHQILHCFTPSLQLSSKYFRQIITIFMIGLYLMI